MRQALTAQTKLIELNCLEQTENVVDELLNEEFIKIKDHRYV